MTSRASGLGVMTLPLRGKGRRFESGLAHIEEEGGERRRGEAEAKKDRKPPIIDSNMLSNINIKEVYKHFVDIDAIPIGNKIMIANIYMAYFS